MPALIVFRLVQGLGAGAVQPMGMTIVGDIYSMAERAKVQGYIASVWAMASVVGPTLGGVFSDYLSWRWIFFVNLPLGRRCRLGAVAPLRRERRAAQAHHRLRWAPRCWRPAAPCSCSACSRAACAGTGTRPPSIAHLRRGGGPAGGLRRGRVARAAEPVLPLWIFRRRVLNAANSGAFVVGVLMLGLTSYVPLYAQGVLGHGALVGRARRWRR